MLIRQGKFTLNDNHITTRVNKSEEPLGEKPKHFKHPTLTILPSVVRAQSTHRTSPDRLDSLRLIQNNTSQSNMFFTSNFSPIKQQKQPQRVSSIYLSNQKEISVFSPSLKKQHIRKNSLVKMFKKDENEKNQGQLSACKLYLTFLNKKEYKSYENSSQIQDEIKTLRSFYQIQQKKIVQPKVDPLFGEFIETMNQQRLAQSPMKGQRGSIFFKRKDSILNFQFVDISNNDDGSDSSPKAGKSSLTEQWNVWYFKKCYEQIIEFREMIKDLLTKINSLQELWKNDDRVQRFLKKELHPKIEIFRKFFKQGKPFDASITHNTFLRMFQEKEIQYYNNKSVPVQQNNQLYNQIYKYQFKYRKDLIELRDTISNILHLSQINDLKSLKFSIVKELTQVKKMEQQHLNQFSDKLQQNQIIFDQRSNLSYFSPCMHYETRDIMLEKAERVLGNFIRPSYELREINDNIKSVLTNLRQQDRQNKKEK